MRILLHDFGGYAFIVPLSRELAARGHDVLHAFCGSVQTPQGVMARQPGDAAGLRFAPLCLPEQIRKHSLVKRWRQERRYARLLADLVRRERPDVVVSANTPSQVQARLVGVCRRLGVRVVTWVQDLYGVAAYEILRGKLPVVGAAVGKHYMRLDRRCLRRSDEVVLITDAFRPVARAWGIDDRRTTVIPNWASLHELPPRPRRNAWSARHGLDDHLCFVYSGTLAMKHNPGLLLGLAERFRGRPGVRVVVVSEGAGADWLRARAAAAGLANLLVMPFQPFADLPDVLGSADVLVSILEPVAGRFSVPSKVLTYLCADRPLLLAVPAANLAAATVRAAGAGLVAPPDDPAAFAAAAERLAGDAALRREMGGNGRRYAEEAFDMGRITAAFERVIGVAPAAGPVSAPVAEPVVPMRRAA